MESQPVSSRTRNKVLLSQEHDVVQLKCKYVVDWAIPVQNPDHFTDTLTSQHASYWKLAAFEHFDQNADTILFSIPFLTSQVLVKYKIYKQC